MDIFSDPNFEQDIIIIEREVTSEPADNENIDSFADMEPTTSSDVMNQSNQDISSDEENTVEESSVDTSLPNEDTFSMYQVDEEDYFKTGIVEAGRRVWKSDYNKQCYLKGCLWSPDGTCILTAAHMDGMHVIELPPAQPINPYDQDSCVAKLTTAIYVPEAGAIYDYVWFPLMNSDNPNTCWFVGKYSLFYND